MTGNAANIQLPAGQKDLPASFYGFLSALDFSGLDVDVSRDFALTLHALPNDDYAQLIGDKSVHFNVGNARFHLTVKPSQEEDERSLSINERHIWDLTEEDITTHFGALVEFVAQMNAIEAEYPEHCFGADVTVSSHRNIMSVSDGEISVTRHFLNWMKHENVLMTKSTLLHELGHTAHGDAADECVKDAFSDLIHPLKPCITATDFLQEEYATTGAQALLAMAEGNALVAQTHLKAIDDLLTILEEPLSAMVDALSQAPALASCEPLQVVDAIIEGDLYRFISGLEAEHTVNADKATMAVLNDWLKHMRKMTDESPVNADIVSLEHGLSDLMDRHEPVLDLLTILQDMEQAIGHAQEYRADMYAMERMDNPADHLAALEALARCESEDYMAEASKQVFEGITEAQFDALQEDERREWVLERGLLTQEQLPDVLDYATLVKELHHAVNDNMRHEAGHTHPSWEELITFAEDYIDAIQNIRASKAQTWQEKVSCSPTDVATGRG